MGGVRMARQHTNDDSLCPAAAYLRKLPENLVVNGYRNWVAGLAHRDSRYWNAAWSAHAEALGASDGQHALDVMASLVRQIGACATCPLRFYQPGAGHLCRDECLVLGMVSAAQNGDDDTLMQSARMLTCTDAFIGVVDLAGVYGAILLGHGHRLTPIPMGALAPIDLRSVLGTSRSGTSLH